MRDLKLGKRKEAICKQIMDSDWKDDDEFWRDVDKVIGSTAERYATKRQKASKMSKRYL